ncbi:MAG: metallopeptidase family protein [Novosphingobium sp.]
MMRRFGVAPAAEEIEVLARKAIAALPPEFAAHLDNVVFMVEDFADPETLAEMGIDDPFELSGLYEGRPLTERSIQDTAVFPDRIRLFRGAILDEWAQRGDETLEHLVAHVTIHEIGHHFGLTDEDIEALEAAAD